MVLEILMGTPAWVFGLFIVLVMLGFQQSKGRTISRGLIIPLPAGMILLSLAGIFSSFGVSPITIGLWGASLVIVTLFSIKYLPVKGVRPDAGTDRIIVDGSWLPLVLMMAIFFTKYFVAVFTIIQPGIVTSTQFTLACCIVYGIFSGIFSARAISMWKAANSPA